MVRALEHGHVPEEEVRMPDDRQMRVPSGSSPPARRASGPDASRPPVFSSPAQTNSVPEQLMQMGATRMSPTS